MPVTKDEAVDVLDEWIEVEGAIALRCKAQDCSKCEIVKHKITILKAIRKKIQEGEEEL